jgi:ABC-type lipoprotein export system ATPase subunit
MHSRGILPFDFVPGTIRENLGSLEGGEERCRWLAQVVGLAASLDKDPAELSVGQRKRLEILNGAAQAGRAVHPRRAAGGN